MVLRVPHVSKTMDIGHTGGPGGERQVRVRSETFRVQNHETHLKDEKPKTKKNNLEQKYYNIQGSERFI